MAFPLSCSALFDKPRSARPGRFAGLVAGALLGLAVPAHAAGLASHSVAFDVKQAGTADKTLYVEGQGSVTLTRRCDGWTLGEVFQVGVEKGEPAPPTRLDDKANRLEERINAQESLDASELSYKAQMRQNGRLTTASGKARLGAEPGKLTADLGRYEQVSDLPAGTLPPAAARAALIDALMANKPEPIEIHTVEILRFHKPIRQIFQRLPPTDTSFPLVLPKDLRVSDKTFAQGRLWALRLQVPDFNEFGDELWLIHESGAIVRQVLQRQGAKLQLEAREVSLFPAPACQ